MKGLGQRIKMIVVSGQVFPAVMAFYEKAANTFGPELVSGLQQSAINGIYTFTIIDSGHKPGSNIYDHHASNRDGFFAWAKEDAKEAGNFCSMVEIEYGGSVLPVVTRSI